MKLVAHSRDLSAISPTTAILLQGLLAGTAEQREQAAYGLGDLVERSSPESFKPYCIQTVGPLSEYLELPTRCSARTTTDN